MGKILDWFTQLLINMDDEDEYVNIGRRLLSVNKYKVNGARSTPDLHEVIPRDLVLALFLPPPTLYPTPTTTSKLRRSCSMNRVGGVGRERSSVLLTRGGLQVFWGEVAHVVEGDGGNTLVVLPEFMLQDRRSFEEVVEKQLKAPLQEWAGGSHQVPVPPFPSTCHAKRCYPHMRKGT